MKVTRKSVLGTSIAVASLALIGVGISAAAPTVSSHTLRFKSVQLTSHNIAHTNRFINTDRDVRNGKYVGNDVFEGTLNPDATVSTVDSFALEGGFIYAHTRTVGKSSRGNVTGGTGSYKGITGTIVVSGSQDSPNVAITYHG